MEKTIPKISEVVFYGLFLTLLAHPLPSHQWCIPNYVSRSRPLLRTPHITVLGASIRVQFTPPSRSVLFSLGNPN
ncbi:hypothetical protein F5148DRAFT_1167003, partial [Russula earlei]